MLYSEGFALKVITTLSSSPVVIKGISIGFTHIDSYDNFTQNLFLSGEGTSHYIFINCSYISLLYIC